MKFSNLKRVISLTLLASAATFVVAAPAPVTDLNSTSSQTSSSSIERLERLIKSRNQIQLQLQQQLDGLSEELSEMRGMVERNSYELDQMLERQRQLYVEIDTLRTAKPTPITTPSDVSNVTGKNEGAYSADTNENEAYQNAVELILTKKDYTGAMKAFQEFVIAYPESVYSSNAHYWLGQLYFAQTDDVKAAKSFVKVVSYADSNKRADALFKLGQLASRNNNKAAAKTYYQKVIDEYSNSTTAQHAATELKSL